MTFDADRARSLNADHHRRMAADAKRATLAGKTRDRQLNDQSRQAIIRAMRGAVGRFALRRTDGKDVSVLELGAGRGGLRDTLMEELGADRYVGVEVVPEVADVSPHVECMPFENAPESWNESFDFIFSRHVMEHVTDVGKAMAALKRLLAPHGVIGAVTPHYFPDPEPAHVTQQRINEWMAAYNRSGFKCVYAKQEHFTCEEAHIVVVHEGAVDLP